MDGPNYATTPDYSDKKEHLVGQVQPTYLTCTACRLLFNEPEQQRQHYREDFHKFNIKRQVVGLGPVTREQYQDQLDRTIGLVLRSSSLWLLGFAVRQGLQYR